MATQFLTSGYFFHNPLLPKRGQAGSHNSFSSWDHSASESKGSLREYNNVWWQWWAKLTQTYRGILRAVLFIIVLPNLKQLRYPSVYEWMNKPGGTFRQWNTVQCLKVKWAIKVQKHLPEEPKCILLWNKVFNLKGPHSLWLQIGKGQHYEDKKYQWLLRVIGRQKGTKWWSKDNFSDSEISAWYC